MIRCNGQLFINRKTGVVRSGESVVCFKPAGIRFKVFCHLVMGPHITAEQLFCKIYSDREDGGPLAGHSIINVHISQLRPVFAKLNLTLGHLYGPPCKWWLEIKQAGETKWQEHLDSENWETVT